MKLRALNNDNGMSLIEAVVSMTILTIMSLGMTQTITQMSRHQRGIDRKLESIEFVQKIQGLLSDDGFCTCNFRNLEVDVTTEGAKTVAKQKLMSNCKTNAVVVATQNATFESSRTGLGIDSIELSDFAPLSGETAFSANITVNWQAPQNSATLKPAKLPIVIETMKGQTSSKRQVARCGLEPSLVAQIEALSCAKDEVLGFDQNGNTVCSQAKKVTNRYYTVNRTTIDGGPKSCGSATDGDTKTEDVGGCVNTSLCSNGKWSVIETTCK